MYGKIDKFKDKSDNFQMYSKIFYDYEKKIAYVQKNIQI